jgi:MFS family permease
MGNNYNRDIKEKTNMKYGALIVLLLFAIMVASNIPTPLYALYAIKFNFGSLAITEVFATYVAFLIPSLLFWGQYSDARGGKVPVVTGIILEVSGIIVFFLSKNISMLFMARALQGLASGAISGPASALLFHYRGKAGAMLTSISTSSGTAVGPLLGGVMAEYFPFPLRLVYILSLIIVIIPSLSIIPLINKAASHNNFKFHFPKLEMEAKNLFVLSAASAFVAWTITAFYMSLSPVYIIRLLNISNIAISGLMVFLMLGIASIMQVLSMRRSIYSSMTIGIISLIFAIVFIIISLPVKSIAIFLLGTIMAGIGQGFTFTGATREIRAIAHPLKMGDTLSSYYIVIYSGVGVPILVLGFLDRILGLFSGILYYGIAIISVSIIIILFLYFYRRKITMD